MKKHGSELSGFGPGPSQRLRCVLKSAAWHASKCEGWATMLLLMLLLSWLQVCFMSVKPCGLLDGCTGR